MDQKTLEYMGERVDKAREIVEKIKDLNFKLQRMASNNADSVGINYGSNTLVYIGSYKSIASSLPPNKRLVQVIRESIIDAIKGEIKILEGELAEL